ncbi:hypothetical protein LTR66_012305, partial [Elasticomyces elasticus]
MAVRSLNKDYLLYPSPEGRSWDSHMLSFHSSAKMTPIAAMAAATKPYCITPDDAASPLKGST